MRWERFQKPIAMRTIPKPHEVRNMAAVRTIPSSQRYWGQISKRATKAQTRGISMASKAQTTGNDKEPFFIGFKLNELKSIESLLKIYFTPYTPTCATKCLRSITTHTPGSARACQSNHLFFCVASISGPRVGSFWSMRMSEKNGRANVRTVSIGLRNCYMARLARPLKPSKVPQQLFESLSTAQPLRLHITSKGCKISLLNEIQSSKGAKFDLNSDSSSCPRTCFFAWAHVFFFPFHKPTYYECAFFLAKPTTHARGGPDTTS